MSVDGFSESCEHWFHMDVVKDNELIERYLHKGDERALEALIARYLPAVFGYARTLTGNPDTAADIAQETFVKAWRNLQLYNPTMEFRGWLFTIAKRTAIDVLRMKQTLPFSALAGEDGIAFGDTIADEGPSVAQQAAAAMSERSLATALAGLPALPAKIVQMRTSDDMTFRSISQKLRLPLNTVKSHYHRALLKLRGLIRR